MAKLLHLYPTHFLLLAKLDYFKTNLNHLMNEFLNT